MSIASNPFRVMHRGHVKPQVLAVAHAVQQHGWRVTSIYRPTGGTHPLGISLDVAPMVYTAGGFGPATAKLLWQLAKQTVPSTTWLAVAEADHIHIQMFDYDAIGINTPSGTVLLSTNPQTFNPTPVRTY